MGSQSKKEEKQAYRRLCTTAFLVAFIVLLVFVYFRMFEAKDPTVQIPRMQLGENGGRVGVQLNLSVSIHNPNRGNLSVEDGSSALLYYGGQKLALTQIPPIHVPARESTTASIAVSTPNNSLFPPAAQQRLIFLRAAVVIVSRVASLVPHRSRLLCECQIRITPDHAGFNTLLYTCDRSHSLDD